MFKYPHLSREGVSLDTQKPISSKEMLLINSWPTQSPC